MNVTFEHIIRSAQPIVFLETGDMSLSERRIRATVSQIGTREGEPSPPVETYDITEEEPLHRWIKKMTQSKMDKRAVFIIRNIQFFLKDFRVVQTIQNSYQGLQQGSRTLICMAPSVNIPEEIEHLVVAHTDELPSSDVLRNVAGTEAVRISGKVKVPQEDIQSCSDAGVGMALPEFERAITLSLVAERKMSPDVIFSMKQQILRRSDMLSLYKAKPEDAFSMIGGLEVLKDFCQRSCKPGARGILILGPPGTGKSCICRSLSYEMKRPMIQMDLSAAYDKYVGGSEAKIRKALQTVDAYGDSILFLDELEKSLSGTKGNSSSDVSARTMSFFLRWLSDRDPKAYVVATCNSVEAMPPEYLRAERWDSIFFVDLPNQIERDVIWNIWRKYYNIPKEEALPKDHGWTGAEIRSCCRISRLLGSTLLDASEYVLPISKTMEKDIERLREWARGRAIWASTEDGSSAGRDLVV